ncbi:polysaccharide biosynthesis protein [Cnuella takakiae]|nr:polysaccharide biosynthesis protein [Cnuella takakiae]
MWYGGSSIAARFLNYLLTPYLTATLSGVAYGEMSLVYAFIPFLNILFTYGLETAFFRFASDRQKQKEVYDTASISLIVSTVVFTSVLLLFNNQLAAFIGIQEHPEYLTWVAYIIAFDTLSTLAFAKLRFDGRPIKFAVVRILGILVNIALTIFLLSFCPRIKAENPTGFIGTFYHPEIGVGYVILANLVQAVVTFLLLSKEFFSFRLRFNQALWKEIILYSSPLILAGLAGMINETFDRLMLRWWTNAPTEDAATFQVGVYSACYKLSILITLFIQAFRMGAEPFFFKQAQGAAPQRTYARVMKFFVITICFMFLAVALFLDIWKHFIQNPLQWEGLRVVPILLLANMFLGVYYNLSIWYKLGNKTLAGAWITLIGAGITLLVNYLFIPRFGYMACAWATFLCYGTMMVVSYKWGQKEYPIPYATKKLIAYFVIVLMLFGLHSAFEWIGLNVWFNHIFGAMLLYAFTWFIFLVERKEMAKLPVVGRFVKA